MEHATKLLQKRRSVMRRKKVDEMYGMLDPKKDYKVKIEYINNQMKNDGLYFKQLNNASAGVVKNYDMQHIIRKLTKDQMKHQGHDEKTKIPQKEKVGTH